MNVSTNHFRTDGQRAVRAHFCSSEKISLSGACTAAVGVFFSDVAFAFLTFLDSPLPFLLPTLPFPPLLCLTALSMTLPS